MTRARFVLGNADLGKRFDSVREAVISAPRDAQSLKAEIVSMRERVRSAHPVRGDLFDVKHSQGGMVDAEFAVQFLVLSQSAQNPELLGNVGNIALLQRAEAGRQQPRLIASCAVFSTNRVWMRVMVWWCPPRLPPTVMRFWPCGKLCFLTDRPIRLWALGLGGGRVAFKM